MRALLRRLVQRHPRKAQEPVSRAFRPYPVPEGHSCLRDPFPWRIAAQMRELLLRPCPSCGHSIAAHTYDRPCSLCTLEASVHLALTMNRKRIK